MKIKIVGSIFGISGYDIHTKQLTNALYKLNNNIKLDAPLPPNWISFVNDEELKMINNDNRNIDVVIAITQPQFWRLYMENERMFCGFLVWEGDKIPEYWIDYIMDERVGMIFVPSQYTKQAVLNTLEKNKKDYTNNIINKLHIIPHGVDTTIFNSQELNSKSPILETPDKFTFVCNKGWRGTNWDRGGVQYLIKAFSEEFKEDENVELLLKLNPSYINPQNIPTLTHKGIKVNCDNIPYNKLKEFYLKGDVGVYSTRAEAFGLPILESMSCGVPCITTNFGGQTDFVNNENGWLIDYKLEEVKEDVMYEGISWAIPDINHLRSIMRYVFNNKEEVKRKREKCLEDVKSFTWDITAKKVIELL